MALLNNNQLQNIVLLFRMSQYLLKKLALLFLVEFILSCFVFKNKLPHQSQPFKIGCR
jgi:hypothetical protein